MQRFVRERPGERGRRILFTNFVTPSTYKRRRSRGCQLQKLTFVFKGRHFRCKNWIFCQAKFGVRVQVVENQDGVMSSVRLKGDRDGEKGEKESPNFVDNMIYVQRYKN